MSAGQRSGSGGHTFLDVRGEYNREIEQLGDIGMGEDVVPDFVGTEIPDELEETDLVVNDQQRALFFVNSFEFGVRH
jgi:hypothetical protein